MKVGDLVKYDVPASKSVGMIVAELPAALTERDFGPMGEWDDALLGTAAVSVLWCTGDFTERVPPRTLEVISESRR